MDYCKLARKKKELVCAHCGSKNVHSVGRATGEEWLWKCDDCSQVSHFGYVFDTSGGMRGVALYRREGKQLVPYQGSDVQDAHPEQLVDHG